MWYWIFKVSILSLIFIFLLHYLYSFFISTLTIPKVKDLVTLPQQKYDELFNSLEQNKYSQENKGGNGNNGNINLLPSSSSSSSQSMKDELIRFMKEIGGGSSGGSSGGVNSGSLSSVAPFSFSK
jgi:uncharacterized membrane protein YgcG